MPKHKPDEKNQDWIESLTDQIMQFENFCVQKLGLKKSAVKKAAKKVQTTAQELISCAKGLAGPLVTMAKDLAKNHKIEANNLHDLKRKGEDLLHKINHTLKHASKIGKEVKGALGTLRDAITEVFKILSESFKNIFGGMLQPSLPAFTPRHQKGQLEHLKGEQAFKANQNRRDQPGIHRKILTTPSGGGKKG